VAARGMLVEKKTIVAGEGVREAISSAVLGLLPASIINDFTLAIAYAGRVWQLWLWRLLRRWAVVDWKSFADEVVLNRDCCDSLANTGLQNTRLWK